MKRVIILSAAIILIVLVVLAAVLGYISLSGSGDAKPFYVGVTFGGNTTAEAKQLIDKVKDYSNLFVLQSGSIIQNLNATEQICDYAVKAGLSVIVYYGVKGDEIVRDSFLNVAQARWGSKFLGIYYDDEPGGKMLDSKVILYDDGNEIITKESDRSISIKEYSQSNYISQTFSLSGTIIVGTFNANIPQASSTTYYANGTITYIIASGTAIKGPLIYQPNGSVQHLNGTIASGEGNISQFESYQQLWSSRPLQTYGEVSNIFVKSERNNLNLIANESSVQLFTSDYALDWFDYLSGYDTIFAQLGWNNTVSQEIGLVRGAANLQDKSWGTIITWKYTQPPYLPNGDEMYNQMRLSYESGAEYVLVFNYAENMTGSDGTLQDEHFQALQRFWNDVVKNPSVVHGGIKAEAALVLPKDYGWGMRNPNDNIWGLWSANSTSQQIWTQLQSKLAQYGSGLDIVYDDPAYPVFGEYSQIYYWNQTG